LRVLCSSIYQLVNHCLGRRCTHKSV
jgi:hypothetical protein